jgi:hypothetical protein
VVTLKEYITNGPSKWPLQETIALIHPRLLTQIHIDTIYP